MNAADRKTILLVDDEKHLLISLRDYLSYENFDVITARSGEEALRVLEKTRPDLIILDISMPGMGGVGFLKRISSADGVPQYPVLVLTARSAMKDFFSTVEVDGFLEKPCEESELIGKKRKIFGRRPGPGAEGPDVRKRVLLAEDDVGIDNRITEALTGAGYEVETVRSGPEVLDKATMLKPHVILMKEILPRLNGSATASLVEVMPSVSMIPVVIYDDTRAGSVDGSLRRTDVKCVKKVLGTSDAEALLRAVRELV